ncbi:MAG: EthD domain-containing protein [Proteobacteria bacterium]|nr:EthD domain-containing protein [Pseudomonadota bacterium]
MEKLVYLVGKPEAQPIEEFRQRLLGPAAEALLAGGALALTVNVADLTELPEAVHISDPDGWLSASVSLWLSSLDDRAPLEEILDGLAARKAGYLVTESVPRDYTDRDWADGERSPGVTLVAAFPKPDHIDDETFFRQWHGSHTPLSLEIHPLYRYIRNSVARALTPGAPAFRAIVEERVRTMREFADPELFYGSAEGQRLAHDDLLTFTDFESMHSTVMSEYILQS